MGTRRDYSLFVIHCSLLAVGIIGFGGCQEKASPPPEGFTFDRGAQLLAAGSPKSAIPFLTQTVTAQPDGPEPVALLSLAYALDLQDERAIVEMRQVHRPAGSPPGWEYVAVGIAEMEEHRAGEGVETFRKVIREGAAGSPVASSAHQWLALALIMDGKDEEAIAELRGMAKAQGMFTSGELWIALIHAQHQRVGPAQEALVACAKETATESGRLALKGNLNVADDQTLYDAGLAALADGDLDLAERLLTRVEATGPQGGDTAIWLALIGSVKSDWQVARMELAAACEEGPTKSRGLASQLFSVVCALEERPEAMIQYTLVGQRMMERSSEPAYIHEQPKPEGVWFSDSMK